MLEMKFTGNTPQELTDAVLAYAAIFDTNSAKAWIDKQQNETESSESEKPYKIEPVTPPLSPQDITTSEKTKGKLIQSETNTSSEPAITMEPKKVDPIILRDEFARRLQAGKKQEVSGILKTLGVERLSSLPAEKYDEAYKLIQAV